MQVIAPMEHLRDALVSPSCVDRHRLLKSQSAQHGRVGRTRDRHDGDAIAVEDRVGSGWDPRDGSLRRCPEHEALAEADVEVAQDAQVVGVGDAFGDQLRAERIAHASNGSDDRLEDSKST
ncbi:hypothetical protein [Variovorax sp. WS11]|uniref:hypothetical protein n=1 Tax=Variovorax sp. WS11 TaxID=1105204 RepID=UPI001EF332A4|nr:hypothetical protein [Variovorax sp. WS11]